MTKTPNLKTKVPDQSPIRGYYLDEAVVRYLTESLEDAWPKTLRPNTVITCDFESKDKPVKVIYNGNTTIAIFPDGKKIISRPGPNEAFDRETGLAMCIAKHVYGSRGKFLDAVDKATTQVGVVDKSPMPSLVDLWQTWLDHWQTIMGDKG